MNCELCGTEVKVVGNTTKHYEPVNAKLFRSGVLISAMELHTKIERLEQQIKEAGEVINAMSSITHKSPRLFELWNKYRVKYKKELSK